MGKGISNVGNEGLVDTLVILSSDLVQVVAKVRHTRFAIYPHEFKHIELECN